MNNQLKVTIIILNWNKKEFLEENLRSVLDQNYGNFEVVVADNGSEDGSVEYLKKVRVKEKRLNVLEFEKNYGYVSGYNKAVKTVLEKGRQVAL